MANMLAALRPAAARPQPGPDVTASGPVAHIGEHELRFIELAGAPSEQRLVREIRAYQAAVQQLSDVISRERRRRACR